MKAIIETGGKQYTVTEGTEIYVEKVTGEAGWRMRY
jgi:ribosomal protein L21